MKKSTWKKTTKEILKLPDKLTVSSWAEANRVVARGTSPEPGLWNNDRTPYLVEPMDACCDPGVETVVMMMSSQVGKTECLLNILGYYAGHDPSPQLVVQPTEKMAEAFSKERLVPMFRESPGLTGRLGKGTRDSSNTILQRHYPGGFIAFAGSNAPAGLATRPIRIAAFDEADRYGTTKEGNPIKLGIQRTQNFYNRKIIIVSTPTKKGSSNIQAWWEKSDQRLLWIPCPHCGEPQVLEWEQLQWDRKEDKTHLPETAVYHCLHCDGTINERQRDEAVKAGEWRPERPWSKIRGYHINALYSSWVKFASLAEEWIEIIMDPNKEGLQEFINLKLGRLFEVSRKQREEDDIRLLKDDRPSGLIPGNGDDIYCLTAALDTQDNGFWYEVRAWGKGFALESWQVAEGFLHADFDDYGTRDEMADREYSYHPAFDQVRQILWDREYKTADGKKFKIILAGIDAMGHKTSEVYDFCRTHKGKIFAIQGMRNRSNRPFKYAKIDTYPGSNKVIPGGLYLLQLDVNNYKDDLSSKLQVSPMDPGAWHLSGDTGDYWLSHLCSEYLDEKTNRWELRENKENHGWDCSVYNLALADVLQIKIMSQQKPKQKKESGNDKKRRSEKKRPEKKSGRW